MPEVFTKVDYDATEITELAKRLAAHAGLPESVELRIEIDESAAFGRTEMELDGTRLTIRAQGGAFEDTRLLRQFSLRAATEVIGRLLYQASDRLGGTFDGAPVDAELNFQQRTAWDVYCLGRLSRTDVGDDVRAPRRRYHFRTRHGFSDTADVVFDRLWNADGLSWRDIEAACDETATQATPSTRVSAGQRA